jgi:hypothetical protein
MNQKEAAKHGLPFGASNAQKVLKRIREHFLWSHQGTLDEWRQFNDALLLLTPIAQRHEALWLEMCARLNEENRRRREARELSGGPAA